MAARSWAGSTGTAIGLAAGAGAAQLGIGYGLGIVTWLPATDPAGKVNWLASLTWVVWTAAASTALGAVAAHRLARTAGDGRGGYLVGAWRTTVALAAAIGALITVPLVAVPARAAESAQNFAPEWTAAGYALLGVMVGLLIALTALTARAIAANVVGSVAYLWVLAVVAVVDSLRDGTGPVLAQLAIWEFSAGPTVRDFYVPGVIMMLTAAFVIGVLAAWRSGRRGDGRVGVAVSGATGPLLVAAAYLLAAPQFVGESTVDVSQWSAYLFAPYAVIAGLAGSVLVAAIGPRESGSERAVRPAGGAVPGGGDGADPTGSGDDPRQQGHDHDPGGGRPPDREPTGPAHPDADLAGDAYAPARAYETPVGGFGPPGGLLTAAPGTDERAYASDTIDGPPASEQPSAGHPPGRAGAGAATRAPLWPTPPPQAGPDAAPARSDDPPVRRPPKR